MPGATPEVDLGVSDSAPAITNLSTKGQIRESRFNRTRRWIFGFLLVQRKRGWLMLHTRRSRPGAARPHPRPT